MPAEISMGLCQLFIVAKQGLNNLGFNNLQK
jgi:hypothetical protein